MVTVLCVDTHHSSQNNGGQRELAPQQIKSVNGRVT